MIDGKAERVLTITRMRNPERQCMCCKAKSKEPETRLHSLEVGRTLGLGRTKHTMQITLCDDCMSLLGEKIWELDRTMAREQHVYNKTNMEDIPACCGDCIISNCKIPLKQGELVEPYLSQQRHRWCKLVKI